MTLSHLWHSVYDVSACGLLLTGRGVAYDTVPTCLTCALWSFGPRVPPALQDPIVQGHERFLLDGDTLSVTTDSGVKVFEAIGRNHHIKWLEHYSDGSLFAVDNDNKRWPVDLPPGFRVQQ